MHPPNSEVPVVVEAEQFRNFIANVIDYAIYTLSPDGFITSWNAGAQRFKGYTANEIIGKHFSRFYTAEDQQANRPEQVLKQAAAGRFEEEGWRVRKDGTRFWASVVLDPIRADDGELLGYTKITRDITERRLTQTALHTSEEQFRILVQAVTDYAIYSLSPDGIVTSWNAGAQRIKGYDAEEVLGSHFSRFYTDEDRQVQLPAHALATALKAGRFETEGWRVRKDGSRFWAHVIIDPIRDQFGNMIGYAKITRDVTERKKADQALAEAKEALFQAQKLEAIGKLTGGIAHDFNNLLNVIMNGLDLLRTGIDRKNQLKAIDSMARAAERGASLTQQLLAFARQQPLKPERLQLNRVIGSFEAVLRRALRSSVELKLKLAQGLPDILADTAQLESALLNLVVNARDAISERGTILISTAVCDIQDNNVLPAGQYVQVTVSDSGCGMSQETMARAVEPFFTTKEAGKGSGLGLSQVYGFMQQVNGDIQFHSQPGQGTQVRLRFPAQTDVLNAIPGEAAEKVLVVDDQPDVLDMAVHLFSSLGYEVLSANSGKEALATLQRHPDTALLFSDVVMPGMSGVELAEAALRQMPGLKVILASGYRTPALQEQGAELERFELISKPYRLADVIRKIKAVA